MMRSLVASQPPHTGLVCPKCQQAQAIVVANVTSFVVAFECQACGLHWVSIHPDFVVPSAPPPEKDWP
jgi:hypothetical protein